MGGNRWKTRVFVMVPVLFILADSGCNTPFVDHFHHRHPTVVVPPAPIPTVPPVQVGGSVSAPGYVYVPQGGLTLEDAIRQVGVSINDPFELVSTFVVLHRPEADYAFALSLVQNGVIGSLFLQPGERVTVVNWSHTRLFQALKAPASATTVKLDETFIPKPKDIESVSKLVRWAVKVLQIDTQKVRNIPLFRRIINESDTIQTKLVTLPKDDLIIQDYLMDVERFFFGAAQAITIKSMNDYKAWQDGFIKRVADAATVLQSKNAPPALRFEFDRSALIDAYRLSGDQNYERDISYVFSNENGPQPIPVKKVSAQLLSQLPTLEILSPRTTLGNGAVMVVRRQIAGRTTEFVLARNQSSVTTQKGLNPQTELMRWILIADGDEIQITDPARLPIITSSLLAPLLKGMMQVPPPKPVRAPLIEPPAFVETLRDLLP